MRGSIKKALLGGVAVAMVATFVPTAASAATADTFKGPGCFFNTDANATVDPQGNQDGVIGVAAVALDASNNPDASATIECWIATPTAADKVSATDLVGTNTGGVITGEKQISYSDGTNHDQNVYLCESDNGGTAVCTLATSAKIPPQAVIDLIDTIFTTLQGVLDTVNQAEIDHVDPVVCPELIAIGAATGGGVGPVTIESNGDLSITPDPTASLFPPNGLFTEIWDCPPYDPAGP